MIDHNVILEDLPTTVRGFVRRQEDFYTVVLNARSSSDGQKKTYEHELYHIINGDFDRDCPVGQIEAEAHGRERP